MPALKGLGLFRVYIGFVLWQVFQLETAMGSAVECFDDSGAVVVPRERFAPVKTTNDLFALRSDAFKVAPCPRAEACAPCADAVVLLPGVRCSAGGRAVRVCAG